MSSTNTRTRADVLADIAAMRASLGTDEPYVSPMHFDELRAEWQALAEDAQNAAWRQYEDRVIDWRRWRELLIVTEEERVAIESHARWFRAVAADMEAGLM